MSVCIGQGEPASSPFRTCHLRGMEPRSPSHQPQEQVSFPWLASKGIVGVEGGR